jgi:uncharacterized protein YfaS (alpha-2-macroglobulin family)
MNKILPAILILIIPSLIFAGAYFYGNTIQYLGPSNSLNGNFYLSSYNENTIFLEMYKVNVPMKGFILTLLQGKELSTYKNNFQFIKTIKYTPNGKSLNKRIDLPHSTGIYYLRLTNSNKYLAHSYAFVSNLKAININDGIKKYLYIRNSVNGKPVNKAIIFISNRNSNKIIQLQTHNYKVDLSKYDYSNLYVCTDNSFTSLYNYVSSSNKFSTYITTDRPIYRPGQKINFKGFFLEKSQNKYQSISNKEFEVKVYNPNNSIIYDKKLKTNNFGTITGSLITNPNAFIGYYTIKFIYGKYRFNGGFYVQAYKKPNFSIKITSDKNYYVYKDKMNYKISLKYFNDQPVVGAKVSVYLYANENDRYYYNHSSKLIYYNSFMTNSKGEINIPVLLNEKINGYCSMDVVAVDETQMEVEKSYSVKTYQGNVSIKFDKYYYNVKPNKKFNVSFNVTDLDKNSLSGTAIASFCGRSYKTEVVNGKGSFEFVTKDIGNYPLIVKFKGCIHFDIRFFVFWHILYW